MEPCHKNEDGNNYSKLALCRGSELILHRSRGARFHRPASGHPLGVTPSQHCPVGLALLHTQPCITTCNRFQSLWRSASKHVPLKEYVANLEAMAAMMRAAGVPRVMLITPPPVDEKARAAYQTRVCTPTGMGAC